MKRALVCGASGLYGSHTIRRLKTEGYHVIGISRRQPKEHEADEYVEADLREIPPTDSIFKDVSELYQFACEVGGLGYISDINNSVEMLRNSMQIDMSILEACRHQIIIGRTPPTVFFASSACIYNMPGKRFYAESDAYPANCSTEFGWQKLYAERLYRAYARQFNIPIRIGRLFNTYGIGMTWRGPRAKSVAALCRKIAEAKDGGTIEVWGSGEQTRSYTYIDDAVTMIRALMNSTVKEPVNLGATNEVSIRDLVRIISKVAGKQVFCSFGGGPSGVSKICCNGELRELSLGPVVETPIEEGLATVYPWVAQRVLDIAPSTV